MIKTVAFVLYTAAIPLVPLWGANHYKKIGNSAKRAVCIALFAVQALVSLGCILTYFKLA